MDKIFFDREVEAALQVVKKGGVILYPTDTIWGLGCDALNSDAIKRIYGIKKREESKSLIILVADERDILNYVAAPDLAVFDFMEQQSRPTTIIFDHAVSLPDNLVSADGSIAIRMVKDEFCRHLIKRLRKPLVSTSANISGTPSPATFKDISDEVKTQVDHIVQWRQDDPVPSVPSQIIKWNSNGTHTIIRS
jgi:L-threonylcarbamoyladenylate synthase